MTIFTVFKPAHWEKLGKALKSLPKYSIRFHFGFCLKFDAYLPLLSLLSGFKLDEVNSLRIN